MYLLTLTWYIIIRTSRDYIYGIWYVNTHGVFQETQKIQSFFHSFQNQVTKGGWNLSPLLERTCLFHLANPMFGDDLVTQGARGTRSHDNDIAILEYSSLRLTHWRLSKIAPISQVTAMINSWIFLKMFEFWLKFDWSLSISIQLTTGQHWFREREREIKFIGLFENRGHRGPYSPYKPFNHNLYIGIIIFPHIDNPQYTGYD